jgi:tRNA-splicing ligase RtcB (3'-phosphate/5'-hydroxy nucleic acid ligase)
MEKKTNIFAEHVEENAMAQFASAMEQDFVVQGALMPDTHQGYSLPIGAVVATTDVIVPAWVGYDIGCGVCALPVVVDVQALREKAQQIYAKITQIVPLGPKTHRNPVSLADQIDPQQLTDEGRKIFYDRGGVHALGTLGSGNHFIEVGADESNQVWIIIHSGSRGIGHGIAGHYMARASGTNKPVEGHFALDVESDDGMAYINDQQWCLNFALQNRVAMLRLIMDAIQAVLPDAWANWSALVNRNHNHADERDGIWIHRKGATHAEIGMEGVIPGNMRDGSFIVVGKGNQDALWSSSHGAGRVLGRNQARKRLDLDTFKQAMNGITAKVCEKTLDESPMAYKDIFEVMRLQSELVEIRHHVKPIVNVKG